MNVAVKDNLLSSQYVGGLVGIGGFTEATNVLVSPNQVIMKEGGVVGGMVARWLDNLDYM